MAREVPHPDPRTDDRIERIFIALELRHRPACGHTELDAVDVARECAQDLPPRADVCTPSPKRPNADDTRLSAARRAVIGSCDSGMSIAMTSGGVPAIAMHASISAPQSAAPPTGFARQSTRPRARKLG